jgi:hypothetical protein
MAVTSSLLLMDLTADGTFPSFSTRSRPSLPLPLKISREWLSVPSRHLPFNACTRNSSLKRFMAQLPVLSFDDTTKVLHLLSFSTLILQRKLARTPCAQYSTTSQVLNPSDSAHFLQQQSLISFAQINN